MALKAVWPSLGLFIILNTLNAQSYRNKSSLRLEDIMKGEEWTGTWPEDVRWSIDGTKVYFTWNPENDLLSSTYSWSPVDRKINKLQPEELKNIIPAKQSDITKDRKRIVWVKNGNLYTRAFSGGEPTLLVDLPDNITSPHFMLNQQDISFICNNNIYLFSFQNESLRVLTDFRTGKEKAEKEAYSNEQEKWLHNEQMELFDILKQREEKQEARKQHLEELRIREPEKIYTGTASVFSESLSPDEHYVVFVEYTRSTEGKEAIMPEYVTESGFTETKKIRRKVGYPYGSTQMGIYNLQDDSVCYADITTLPGIHDFPVFGEKQTWETRPDQTRTVYLSNAVWSDNGKLAVINIKSADNKDRWIALLDLSSGKLTSLDRQHDEAWIEGPGLGEFTQPGTLGWLPDNKTLYFQSEETGYSHLYLLDTGTGKKTQLTSGKYEIYNPFLSRDKKTFYFTSNEEDPGVRQFYSMPAGGGPQKRLSSMIGNNEVSLSPDEKHMIIRYSYANKPWELYYKVKGSDKPAQKITDSSSDAFKAYTWRVPDFIHFTASDGVSVPARLYLPEQKVRNGAAVIFVHGAGYLQNAHKWWSEYFREYMFHNFLVDNGYTVLDIDYRGSAGYGRDWRTAIYRYMGGKDLSDNVDGASYLVKEQGIEKDRVGIYGGSYGGFITLMAQFTSPGTFKSGAALRSVTDWAHYNEGYTSDILNTPFTDSIAYYRSSPINFAAGLQGNLLMCHGMIDDNVIFQDIIRLTQRLIELKKDNWELAVFPLESHAFLEWTSWLDEYKRVYKLFDETIGEGRTKAGDWKQEAVK